MEITKQQLIEDFIKNNKLNFNDSGSGLNSTCTILSGYACYIGINSFNDLLEYIIDNLEDIGVYAYNYSDELQRAFKYTYNNNYGKWWNTEEAKKQYKF